jgi:hypothetical protein
MLGNVPTVSDQSYSDGGAPFTRYSQDGVPEYGAVGYGTWQEAGTVNLGGGAYLDNVQPSAPDLCLTHHCGQVMLP